MDMIAAHLDASMQPLGMYLNVDEAQQKSHFLVLDFDDHDKKGIAYQPTLEVAMHPAAREIPFLVFRSGGGHGYHIWLAFEMRAASIRSRRTRSARPAGVDCDGATFVAVSSGNSNRAVMNAKGQKIGVEQASKFCPRASASKTSRCLALARVC
ncbi:MAG: hypothetical protein U5N55_04050 [Cypionkella sp.]|nr:hypothetical protein [Cypionkella sp.]